MNAGEPVGVIEPSERMVIDQVVERLAERFPGVPSQRVADVVYGCHSRFDGRPIRDYIPLFVERVARAQLAEQSRIP